MNKYIKSVAGFALMIALLSTNAVNAQEQTEIKLVNGIKSNLKIVIAKHQEGGSPEVIAVVPLKGFGAHSLVNIPLHEHITVGGVEGSSSIATGDKLSGDYMGTYSILSLENASSCTITTHGTLSEKITFTLSELTYN